LHEGVCTWWDTAARHGTRKKKKMNASLGERRGWKELGAGKVTKGGGGGGKSVQSARTAKKKTCKEEKGCGLTAGITEETKQQ